MHIGYIGLGVMGGALARRLAGSHTLSVCDLNSSAVAALEKLGASAAPSAAEVARRCDIILLCLPRSADVRQVIFGAGGLVEGLSPGKIVIDQTSGVPAETRAMAEQLAKQGVAMIDAPVSGGLAGAVAGTIAIMASGPVEVYEKVLPVLSAISPNVFRCGERVGDGQAMKMVNNAMSAGTRLATLEVAAMGAKMGLSLETMADVINKGSGRNRTSKIMLPALAAGKESTSFALALMLKDLSQAISLGMESGAPMPIASLVRGLLQIGVNTLGDHAQLEDMVKLIESMAGTRLAGVKKAVPASGGALPGAPARDLTVGYVGLGTMGGALVRRMQVTRKLHVFDIRPEVTAEFGREGAIAANDLPSLARACDVIFVCVPTSAHVREVVFGKGGLVEGIAAGKIVVDQTTGDPVQTRAIAADLAKLGVPMVDAPVSGGPRGAVAGTIAIMCGGPDDAFAAVRPILELVSPNVVHCGETGNGHVAKLVNNAVASCNRLITYESVTMGVKCGLKLADMSAVINKGTGWNGASERILPVLAKGGETANFQLALMVKDLKLAAQMGMNCGAPMLIANEVRNIFEVGAHELGGTKNLDAMAGLFEAMAEVRFADA